MASDIHSFTTVDVSGRSGSTSSDPTKPQTQMAIQGAPRTTRTPRLWCVPRWFEVHPYVPSDEGDGYGDENSDGDFTRHVKCPSRIE